jgi:uncharacterized membrane protein
MGPLQFMVVGFDEMRFCSEVLPELRSLTTRKVVRVVDLVVVHRLADGSVIDQEVAELIPEEDMAFLSARHIEGASEWFTQEDIHAAGDCLTEGTSVALLLIEHRWAEKLEDTLHDINQSMLSTDTNLRDIPAELERQLVLGSNPLPA